MKSHSIHVICPSLYLMTASSLLFTASYIDPQSETVLSVLWPQLGVPYYKLRMRIILVSTSKKNHTDSSPAPVPRTSHFHLIYWCPSSPRSQSHAQLSVACSTLPYCKRQKLGVRLGTRLDIDLYLMTASPAVVQRPFSVLCPPYAYCAYYYYGGVLY